MGLVKCPRCELNYMKDTEKVCDVCRKEMKGEVEPEEALDLCPECNEYPPVAGHDLCSLCLKEKMRLEAEEAVLLSAAEPDVEMDEDEFVEDTATETLPNGMSPETSDEMEEDMEEKDDDDPPSELMGQIEEVFGAEEAESFEEDSLGGDDDEDEE